MNFQPRDFIETSTGLVFAVVDGQADQGQIPCFLRYRRTADGWVKLNTAQANGWLAATAPRHLMISARLSASLHGVRPTDISKHHRPRARVRSLIDRPPADSLEEKARRCLIIFQDGGIPIEAIGITGSLLIGAQHPASDLDFVFYDRALFQQARMILQAAMAAKTLSELDHSAWREAWDRRDCELTFDEYLWHERRKHHKALCEGTKLDITLVTNPVKEDGHSHKLGPIRIETGIRDAELAFDFPARYRLTHPLIRETLSFSHTYAGQALKGERVEIAGQLEVTASGQQRIIVGSNREAMGEYIRVLRSP